eukprot:10202096-Ditylum_brightwellii.AAC.1
MVCWQYSVPFLQVVFWRDYQGYGSQIIKCHGTLQCWKMIAVSLHLCARMESQSFLKHLTAICRTGKRLSSLKNIFSNNNNRFTSLSKQYASWLGEQQYSTPSLML